MNYRSSSRSWLCGTATPEYIGGSVSGERDVDVIVVGAGNAAFSAALVARTGGLCAGAGVGSGEVSGRKQSIL